MNAPLAGNPLEIRLPVRLSRQAIRQARIETGREPHARQSLTVEDLTPLGREDRIRLVDIWERVTVGGDRDEEGLRMEPEMVRYDRLSWRYGQWLITTEGGQVDIDRVFFSEPGRTVRLTDHLRAQLDNPHELDALLDDGPLVTELGEDGSMTLDGVAKAFDRAFELVRQIEALVKLGRTFGDEEVLVWSDNAIFFGGQRATALLHDSDPTAFAKADSILHEADDAGVRLPELAREVCKVAIDPWDPIQSDDELVERVVIPKSRQLIESAQEKGSAAEAQVAYERERERWIAKHGSERLKRASARGYKHDGIYRDERLEHELPGFGSLGRKVEVREVVNPAAESVEAESETLERVAGLGLEGAVRIVWVKAEDYQVPDGEYVQVERYLGRHTVYLPTRTASDDIPF